MLFLTDGYKGEAHVRADHIGYYNLGMVGYDNGYFPSDYVGSFETEILSSNKVRIKQGVGLIGGRRFAIDSYEDVTIENGATGEKRIDVIYFVHTQADDGKESIVLEVVKGTPTSGTPSCTDSGSSGPIPNIAQKYYATAFLVYLEGVNITKVEMSPTFRNLRSIRNVYEYAVYYVNDFKKSIESLKQSALDLGSLVDGAVKSWDPVLYSCESNGVNNTEYYAGGYAVRKATRKIIAKRCFLDIWLTINALGNIGTGERIMRIRSAASADIPASGAGIYSAAIGYVSGVVQSGQRITASIAPGSQYISLFLNEGFLKAKDITSDFQIRLSLSYDMQ